MQDVIVIPRLLAIRALRVDILNVLVLREQTVKVNPDLKLESVMHAVCLFLYFSLSVFPSSEFLIEKPHCSPNFKPEP